MVLALCSMTGCNLALQAGEPVTVFCRCATHGWQAGGAPGASRWQSLAYN